LSSVQGIDVGLVSWANALIPTNPEHEGDSTHDHFRDDAGYWPMSACLRVSGRGPAAY